MQTTPKSDNFHLLLANGPKYDAQCSIEIYVYLNVDKITQEKRTLIHHISHALQFVAHKTFDVVYFSKLENATAPIRNNNSDKNDTFTWLVLVSINNVERDAIHLFSCTYIRMCNVICAQHSLCNCTCDSWQSKNTLSTHIVCYKND